MRLIAREYRNGVSFAMRLTNDGRYIVETFKGERQPSVPEDTYLEIACVDNADCFDKLKESLVWAIEEVDRLREERCTSKR